VDLSFYPLTLEALDQANSAANAEALCLFVGEDERPLVGLAGLCDWRLSGSLSRMLRRGLVKGEEGEALLTPGLRLGFRKLFLFGMGPSGQSEEELASRLADRIRKLGLAGVEDAAFQIPHKISLDLGIRTLIDEPNGPARARVFGADPAAMVRALSGAASRGSIDARLERRVIKVPSSHQPQPPTPGRKGKPVRPEPTELPKASQLPFAPTIKVITALERAAQEKIAQDKLELERAEQQKAAAERAAREAAEKLARDEAEDAALQSELDALEHKQAANLGPEKLEGELPADARETALVADETPIAPAISEPPVAPSASEPPLANLPIAPIAEPTPLPPVAPVVVRQPEPSASGKPKLPVDYKAARFVPPEPKTPPAGGKKNKKKKR
jgi:hypothetical protein